MSKHASIPYNPNIAHVFYLAGFIESWGRGIEKICSACQKESVPQPEYTINPGDIMIKFTASEDRIIRVTDKEQELLILLAEDPDYTMPQLAERLGVSRKTVAASPWTFEYPYKTASQIWQGIWPFSSPF